AGWAMTARRPPTPTAQGGASAGEGGGAERAVEVEGSAVERDVGERLRDVAQHLAAGAGLLGERPEMVGVAEHALEEQARLVQAGRVVPTGARERLYQPEGADVEGALLAGQAVGGARHVVAEHLAVREQPAVAGGAQDGVERAQHARIVGGDEED